MSKVAQETKSIEQFEAIMKDLAEKQNKFRDEFLENLQKDNHEVAEKNYKELQAVSLGIQLCQQSIMRERDRTESEARQKVALELAAKEEQLAKEVLAEADKPEKRGILSFLRGGK